MSVERDILAGRSVHIGDWEFVDRDGDLVQFRRETHGLIKMVWIDMGVVVEHGYFLEDILSEPETYYLFDKHRGGIVRLEKEGTLKHSIGSRKVDVEGPLWHGR